MNPIQKAYCRCFQLVFRLALPVLPYRNPKMGSSLEEIPAVLEKERKTNPMIITDRQLAKLGMPQQLQSLLHNAGYEAVLFDRAFPNPTTDLAKAGAQVYRENRCDSIIAFGGGSAMDVAKAVGVSVVRPRRSLEKMAGILKVRRRLPLLIAVPTTAGTGSETTLAAVLIDETTRHKFAINDFPLIPRYAILDPKMIHTLPGSVAAATGMDALTHAVEAYIGRSTTAQTRRDAEHAVALIFQNLDAAVAHESLEAERAMLEASHYAGRAFTRSYVGYIHAISHSLSGRYDFPHGWTNAVILPIVLRKYGTRVHKKLAALAICAGLGDESVNRNELAERFIAAIEAMNERYGIPKTIDGIAKGDVPMLAKYAHKEANPLYPVPVLWDAKELEEIYAEVSDGWSIRKSNKF